MTFETHKLSTASELLAALRPTAPAWGQEPGRWLFRGHADALWPLRPAAFREEAWVPFGGFDPNVEDERRAAHELKMLRWFAEHLNDAGIPVPGLGLLELTHIDPLSHTMRWPHDLVELAALAQHHGIPTRLLDVTRSAYVAAYFAAQPESSGAAHLGVWAMDSEWLLKNGPDYEGGQLWLSVERALRASNPNLHAQSGLFITWMGDTYLDALSSFVAKINRDVLTPHREKVEAEVSPFRLFTLPRSEAVSLLGLLAREGIDAAKLFPGVNGVVQQLKEQVRHRIYGGPFGGVLPPWEAPNR